MRAIAEQGFSVPTPIQAQAIPVVLKGQDLLATAQTGTGKTAGFVLPLLDRLAMAPRQKGAGRRIRALILTPTRELAVQVEQHIRMLGAYASFVSTTVYGGVSMRAQIQTLQRGVDILVATPGRLLDHVQQRTIDLRNVEIFVLDEADRMLDMGFMPDVRRIASLLSPERQTLMFSATFDAQTRALASATLRSPVTIDVAHANKTTDLVTQSVYMIAQEQKTALLKHLITTEDLQQVLVFTKTKHGADRLASALERAGITADAIHGDKRQAQRTRILQEFKRGGLQALVATDVAARGIDINGLPGVVNFDLPMTPENYVHRIGRTGRAGIKGQAISLVTPAERGAMMAVERHLKYKIERRTPSNFQFQAADGTSKHVHTERPHTERLERSRDDARSHHRPKHEGAARPPYQERSFSSDRKPAFGAPSGNGAPAPRRNRPTEAPRAERSVSIGGFEPAANDFSNRPRRAGKPSFSAGRSSSARTRSY
ncbi:MAG: DEAD/DEAH box helicase [Burkholderiales bacterium]